MMRCKRCYDAFDVLFDIRVECCAPCGCSNLFCAQCSLRTPEFYRWMESYARAHQINGGRRIDGSVASLPCPSHWSSE